MHAALPFQFDYGEASASGSRQATNKPCVRFHLTLQKTAMKRLRKAIWMEWGQGACLWRGSMSVLWEWVWYIGSSQAVALWARAVSEIWKSEWCVWQGGFGWRCLSGISKHMSWLQGEISVAGLLWQVSMETGLYQTPRVLQSLSHQWCQATTYSRVQKETLKYPRTYNFKPLKTICVE